MGKKEAIENRMEAVEKDVKTLIDRGVRDKERQKEFYDRQVEILAKLKVVTGECA